MKIKWIELLQDKDRRLSKTALMFLIWMIFLMATCGYVSFHEKKMADLPESYVFITLVLCGTYTARRFIDGKFGNTTPAKPTT